MDAKKINTKIKQTMQFRVFGHWAYALSTFTESTQEILHRNDKVVIGWKLHLTEKLLLRQSEKK